MNEYKVECYIEDDDNKIAKLSSLNENELKEWKCNIEKRALSEYYHKKIKIVLSSTN